MCAPGYAATAFNQARFEREQRRAFHDLQALRGAHVRALRGLDRPDNCRNCGASQRLPNGACAHCGEAA